MTDAPTKSKYKCKWAAHLTDLDIEFEMIRCGGKFTFKNKEVGNGLFFHYKEAQKLLWPEEDHHRWSDLVLETILNERITVIVGCKDSGKTHGMSKYALVDYWAFPEITLTLMSSTDIRGLELRVWGDIKDLFNRARERYPWLCGNVVDAKHGIFTDSLGEEAEIRDMRKGIICFLRGTLVDTPYGAAPIEIIEPGDLVTNACGIGRVKRVYSSIATNLVRVTLANGKIIDCTPEHPFFTERGWTKAIDLTTCDMVLSAYETMSLLSQADGSGVSESEVLFQAVPRKRNAHKVQAMQGDVSSLEASKKQVLQSSMCGTMGRIHGSPKTESFRKVQTLRQAIYGSSQSQVLFDTVSAKSAKSILRRMWENVSVYKAYNYPASKEVLRSILQIEMDQSLCGGQIAFSDIPRSIIKIPLSRCSSSPSDFHGSDFFQKYATPLRDRFGFSKDQTRHRSGRRIPQASRKNCERSNPNQVSGKIRVVSVEVLKPTSKNGFEKSRGGYSVYNLEVEGHPSYSVNGVIVHNCIPCIGGNGEWVGLQKYVGIKQKRRRLLGDECQFLRPAYMDSLSNLDKGDFKGVFAGNPLGQGDPLDKMSEPEKGWDSLGEITKTTTWQNKFGGITVNLVGIDSPNFDPPITSKPRFSYMIAPEDEKRVAQRWGKDSVQYYSQIMGVRKPGLNAHRVLTRELCLKFGAFDDVIWSGKPRTSVYGIDASYGGDRCVGGYCEFGEDVNDVIVLKVHPPVIIPILVKSTEIPEDQIATFVRADCERVAIPPENVFYDSTGRGSLGTSFGRIWSSSVNPIEFGGNPSSRPVSHDTYIYDDRTKERRLKLAHEHYSKFVTELYFSARYTVESGQMRNLPQDVLDEFALREWTMVRGDKIELETKIETKERMGCSPDLADWLVICVEGARRLGFRIERLAAPDGLEKDTYWLARELDKHKSFVKRNELVYQ